jgi:hypothetical protein
MEPALIGSQSQPFLTFNSKGRPYLAFVRERADGTGEVRFTLFLVEHWAYSIDVSSPSEDASHPEMTLLNDRTVEVTYTLADGTTTTRTIHLPDPHTIFDDIYPFLAEAVITEGMAA